MHSGHQRTVATMVYVVPSRANDAEQHTDPSQNAVRELSQVLLVLLCCQCLRTQLIWWLMIRPLPFVAHITQHVMPRHLATLPRMLWPVTLKKPKLSPFWSGCIDTDASEDNSITMHLSYIIRT